MGRCKLLLNVRQRTLKTMNIFVLHNSPDKIPALMYDKHVGKMILESAQMLSNVFYFNYTGKVYINPGFYQYSGGDKKLQKILDTYDNIRISYKFNTKITVLHSDGKQYEIYAPAHINHPCSQWVRNSMANCLWLIKHAYALNKECIKRGFPFTKRNPNGEHSSLKVVHAVNAFLPYDLKFNYVYQTPFALAMDEEYMSDNAVRSYRNYYLNEKQNIAKPGEPNRLELYLKQGVDYAF